MKAKSSSKTPGLKNGISKSDLPFVYLNLATTADGKIAPTHYKYVRFSSDRDWELLLELRTRADAVMSGAHTVNSAPMNLGPGGKKYQEMRLKNGLAEYNLRIVVSGSASVSPEAEIFKEKFSPVVVLTTERAPKKKLDILRSLGADVKICGKMKVNFTEAFRWLRKEWNVKRLLCEGGGEVNAALFQENLVDELYLTLSPVIFGGRNAPTLADGEGVQKLAEATQMKLKAMERIGDELFLVYRVKR